MHFLFSPNGVLLHFFSAFDWLEADFIKLCDFAKAESLNWRHGQRELLCKIMLLLHIRELEESKSLSALFRHTFQGYLIKRLFVLLSSDHRSCRERLPDEFNHIFFNPVLINAYDT